jgi:hypothetical protein
MIPCRVGAGAVRTGKKRPGDVYKWGCVSLRLT